MSKFETAMAVWWIGTIGSWFLISWMYALRNFGLARIMRDGEGLTDGCGKKRAIHVANRCLSELRFGSALRHSRHERRYVASV